MSSPRAPRLELLWETGDPNDVMRERFGFADAASAGGWVAATVHDHWGLRISSCDRIVMSDRNALAWLASPAGRLIAKWSLAPERFPRLAHAARLTSWLQDRGLPVSAPIVALGGHHQVEVDQVSMGLQRVIDGHLLDVGDHDQVRDAGAVLARLHRGLQGYPGVDRIVPGHGRADPLAARIGDWVDSAGTRIASSARDTLVRLVADAPTVVLPGQLLHGDFRSANLLCAGSRVVAIIDFEDVRVGCRIDEIARSALLLGTRFRNWAPVSADVRAAFLSGYGSAWPLTRVEHHWLDILLLWYAVSLVPAGDDPEGWGASAASLFAERA